jgi:hypothetical protein
MTPGERRLDRLCGRELEVHDRSMFNVILTDVGKQGCAPSDSTESTLEQVGYGPGA